MCSSKCVLQEMDFNKPKIVSQLLNKQVVQRNTQLVYYIGTQTLLHININQFHLTNCTMLNSLLQKVTDPIPSKPQRDQMVIPLIREQPAKIPKSERITLKLRSNPSQADSQTYEISTYAFDHGSPEEWLHHQEVLRKIFIGQNATTGPQRFALARRFLKGRQKLTLKRVFLKMTALRLMPS